MVNCDNGKNFEISEICSEIISLSNYIGSDGFDNIQMADIDELMQDGPIDEDDLIEMRTINQNKNVNSDDSAILKPVHNIAYQLAMSKCTTVF